MPELLRRCHQCDQKVFRRPSQIKGNVFCSHHCSAVFSNTRRVTSATLNKRRRQKEAPFCAGLKCGNRIKLENRRYCSQRCRDLVNQQIRRSYYQEIIDLIRNFIRKNHRPPFKREFILSYRKAVIAFGNWGNAIRAAGFEPNPVRFSKHFVANDGHPCDSLSEKIIDDWLFARKIPHEVKAKYPWNNGMSADFKVGSYWIELFGLTGQLQSYDRLMKIKLEKVKEYNLNLIGLYLSDLFPNNHLEEKLGVLQT